VADLVRSRRVHDTQRLTVLPDGSIRLTMTVGDLTELTSWILGWGKTAHIVEPEELAQSVKNELREALARYASDDHAAVGSGDALVAVRSGARSTRVRG